MRSERTEVRGKRCAAAHPLYREADDELRSLHDQLMILI